MPTVDEVFARLRGGPGTAPGSSAPVLPVASAPAPSAIAGGTPVGTPVETPTPAYVSTPVQSSPASALPAWGNAVSAEDPVPLALGILMHRHSLTRVQAAQRLRQLAADKGLSPAQQASRLVDAVEELASSSPAA